MLSKFRIKMLILYSMGLGFVLFAILTVIPKNIGEPVPSLVMSAGFFFWGVAGIAIMLGRDVVKLGSRSLFGRDPSAIPFYGLLLALISFGTALFILLTVIGK